MSVEILGFGFAPLGFSPLGSSGYSYSSPSALGGEGLPSLATGDWSVNELGQPIRTRSLETRITLCLKTERGSFLSDPEFGLGPIPLLIDEAGLSQMDLNIRRALLPVSDAIVIRSIEFDTSEKSLGRLKCLVSFSEIGKNNAQNVSFLIT